MFCWCEWGPHIRILLSRSLQIKAHRQKGKLLWTFKIFLRIHTYDYSALQEKNKWKIFLFFKWRFPCGPRLCSWLAFLMTKLMYSCRYTRKELNDRFSRILLRIKDKTRRTLPWLEYESFDQMSLVESTEEESGAGFWVTEERVMSKHWVAYSVVLISSRWF